MSYVARIRYGLIYHGCTTVGLHHIQPLVLLLKTWSGRQLRRWTQLAVPPRCLLCFVLVHLDACIQQSGPVVLLPNVYPNLGYVHAMFGHAKAREIASEDELVRRTNKYGISLLTRQSRETDKMRNDHRTVLQYAWIKYRIVRYAELEPCLRKQKIDNKYVQELRKFLQSQNLIHCIVTNIHDESWVITSYFWEQVYGVDVKEALQSTILDFLETDDPSIIADAASDPIFQKALMQHFSGGDTKEQRNWHTLSKLQGPTNLLTLCCQNNYSACVDLLLSEHAPETAKHPWLTFAEPILSMDKQLAETCGCVLK